MLRYTSALTMIVHESYLYHSYNTPIAQPLFAYHHVTYSVYFFQLMLHRAAMEMYKEESGQYDSLLCSFPLLFCTKWDAKIPTVSHVMACKHWLCNRSIVGLVQITFKPLLAFLSCKIKGCIAQMVRALVCKTRGIRFKSRSSTFSLHFFFQFVQNLPL